MKIEYGSGMFSLPIQRDYIMDEHDLDLLREKQTLVFSLQESAERRETEMVCNRYASDTWTGLAHMSRTPTGFPVDMTRTEDGVEFSDPITSPTNIGLFLTSVIAAHDLDLVSSQVAEDSIDTVLTSLGKVDKDHGLFYNWYNTQTGDISENIGRPFISTVDNAWLAAGLMAVEAASSPEHSDRAKQIIDQMNLPLLYDWNRNLFYGGYFADSHESVKWHYDILNTEARIASYVGISRFNIPEINYGRLGKYSPADVPVPTSQNRQHFSSWGGSMFEALMPTLFVPEQEWSKVWQDSHKKYVEIQMKDGERRNNGFWGISPCYNGTYHEEGLPELAVKEGGYGALNIITPHASFLSIPFAPTQAVDNLVRLEQMYPTLYKKGFGFSDSVDVGTGEVSNTYLALDQAMSIIALANYLSGNRMHDYLSPQLAAVRPLIASVNYDFPLVA